MGETLARTNRSHRFVGRQKAMMGKAGNACLSQCESCRLWMMVQSSFGKLGWHVTTRGTQFQFRLLLHKELLTIYVLLASLSLSEAIDGVSSF